jgi:hypothetical protein
MSCSGTSETLDGQPVLLVQSMDLQMQTETLPSGGANKAQSPALPARAGA